MLKLTVSFVLATLTCADSTKGKAGCPCIQYDARDSAPLSVESGQLVYQPVGSGAKYYYSLDYGSVECKAHDSAKPPVCSNTNPQWCFEKWCYVDRKACNLAVYRSKFFPQETNLYYSYATCAEGSVSNSFERWSASNIDGTTRLTDLIQGYLQASRSQIELAYKDVAGSASVLEGCGFTTMCPCAECIMNEFWKNRIDAADVGFWPRSQNNLVSCLSKAIAFTFRKVAGSESNAAASRVGYQYFADQMTGSYVGWPNVEWCPAQGYDPRYRPWYAAGATGPKDVVIVIDVSGSMGTASRDDLAKKAAKAILDTLTWKDHASIVQFDGSVVGVFSTELVSVTYAQRKVMHRWIDTGDGARGGTNFEAALFSDDGAHPGAFKVLRDSVKKSKTSMCQKAIMFLTDGSSSFSDSDFDRARRYAEELDVVFFTYALGNGANTEVTRRLACENRGIFYKVPDGGDLATTMADYYAYFAAGQEMCGASFVEYLDAFTQTQLYAGCLPMYDRTGTEASLLGVSCMDLNLVASVDEMKAKEGWRDMISIMSDMSKTCRPVYLTSCHLEKLRAKSARFGAQVCDAAPSRSCPCLAPGCTDDTDWLDEKGYFCDTWIGDDCDKASSDWGYTQRGQADVLQKCRRSCGHCEWKDDCPYTSASPCSAAASAVPQESRACRTSKVSGVDMEGCAMSCGKVGNDFYSPGRKCDLTKSHASLQVRVFVMPSIFLALLWLLVR